MADAVASNGTGEEGGGGGSRRTGRGSGKVPRLPRWTRQEILVLIQGKKVAERRGGAGGRGRSRIHHMGGGGTGLGTTGNPLVAAVVEPKWASVSSYCRRHGVHRGPVQCRKRWSNLAGDFKRIRGWEVRCSRSSGGESYWTMRNDVRREKKLPGFFDREVYDILDGAVELGGEGAGVEEEGKDGDDVKQEKEQTDAVAVAVAAANGGSQPPLPTPLPPAPPPAIAATADEGRGDPVVDSAEAAEDDELFSDSQHNGENGEEDDKNDESPAAGADDHPPPRPDQSAEATTPLSGTTRTASLYPTRPPDPGSTNGNCVAPENITINENISRGVTKQIHSFNAEPSKDASMECRLIHFLDQNNKLLATQLESHNVSCQLDREERKEMIHSVVRVLGKLASALEKMADKL